MELYAGFFFGFIAGALTVLIGDRINESNVLPWLKPKPPLALASWKKIGDPFDYILTLTDGRQYRGDCTVWHLYPEGTRATLDMEIFLNMKYNTIQWEERNETDDP